MLGRVFVFSDFAAKSCIRNPGLICNLIITNDLLRSYSQDDYINIIKNHLENIKDENQLSSVLRQIRMREMLRIACRDLGGLADLEETMADLSGFADACIEGALFLLYQWHCEKWGIPLGSDSSMQSLVVLGMGKLGARELNFSSDIDLIFVYPEPGKTHGGLKSITNDDFFIRLGRRLIHVLGAKTYEGIVFRVDMNLRPFGESGPLAMSFDAAEAYYHEQGREWERYAWIKARVAAGDRQAGKKFLNNLKPFIYRRYLDYGIFESLRNMKRKISLEVRRKGMENNIKLGPGGIREVEFFGQIFQLLRGGVLPMLQERRIKKVLNILAHEDLITHSVCNELLDAYNFLRNTEHRLQEYADAQTHELPRDNYGGERLAASLGFSAWHEFKEKLQYHTNIVHKHFSSLLKTEETGDEESSFLQSLVNVWSQPCDDIDNQDILKAAGYDNPKEILTLLQNLRLELKSGSLSREGHDRIHRLMPMILSKAGRSERPDVALDRIINLVKAIRQRTSYVSLFLENPYALEHLVNLADTSAWILNFLIKHPVLLDELLDPRTLYTPPERPLMEQEIRRKLRRINPDDLEYQMDELRIFKQVNILHVAAADISDSMPLMKVSDYLSDIAEIVLNQTLEISWNHLVKKHGLPACDFDAECGDRGFAVIAYGKLGGLELGYNSDLDMVFLHSGTSGYTKGERPVDNTTFFARLGQRVLHILSSYTATGKLYDPDMRLRPSGSSGILVSHVEAFRDYQLNQAWTWEKQALVRARPIAGDQGLQIRFQEIRRQILAQPRDKDELRKQILDMRNKMKQSLFMPEPGIFDLKQGRGGIVDIEFLVQYLVLLHAHNYPELLEWTDNVRLIKTLADTGIIDDITAYLLRKAYLIYRAAGHKQSLKEKHGKVKKEQFSELRKKVIDIWEQFI
ncbi:Bifunctional glutamine synthetase adenylyltransferase/adenylyl-removing enzyme [Desulfonema limicola]|uniref:Bifunctional glutamine synthetase adenylyltransferase/adenylyl-removing enzyme n=1 Tax=Desulfonema limicola TaxID=45656 RepID=A0A975B333_9BACT|nr:bifunctional [glutamate--ammonia ligase]-adenylyl-L-tyrosine phosphorylase/[glutamate--ammonia-ligase] adenylyltransferase [Desulfonema limicola]QTA77897.1 Bifunctional glutamine synthetase adenylyltransferase/adenylyl-removing enzyme [Desulfonema limicola]